MSIIEKMTKIINEGDTSAGEQLIHDDYHFLMHASGKKLNKQDVLKWLGMKDVKKEKIRINQKLHSCFYQIALSLKIKEKYLVNYYVNRNR